jgi:large subunit ribosomal protein L28
VRSASKVVYPKSRPLRKGTGICEKSLDAETLRRKLDAFQNVLDDEAMARECDFCGKKTTFGKSYARRGLAKKVGGVGKRITGKTRRTFKPNIQKVRAKINGNVTRVKICTKCLRSNRIQKP